MVYVALQVLLCPPWLWAALPAAGATVAIASNSDSKHHSGNDNSPTIPDDKIPTPSIHLKQNEDGSISISGKTIPNGKIFITDSKGGLHTGTANTDGSYKIEIPKDKVVDGEYSVRVMDDANNSSDNVRVKSPTADLSHDGTEVTGKALPGGTVIIKDDTGKLLGSGVADSEGNYKITITPAQTNGENLNVSVQDVSGNISADNNITAADTTPPLLPKDVTVTGNDDGSLNITGNTEPGADVTVTLPDGSTITGKADENGNIDIKVPSPAADGEYGVTVTDGAGNQSPTVDIIYGDDTAPNAPENLAITGNDDGSLNITGNTEPGADVTVTLPDGSTITGKADENGNIDIKVPSPAAEGDYSVVVKDQAGNESPVSDVTYSDIIAPVAPTANINHAGTEVTGTAEAGSMVIVRDAENNIVGQIIAGNDGTYKVTLSPAVNNGEELVVTATDSAGNVSSETEITAPDITPPAAIIDIVSISDDTGISDSDFITSDTSLTINGKLTGTLETNEHAQISIDGGATWLDLTVDTEGQWSFVDDRTLTNGNYDYAVRVVDDAGNVGSTDSQTVVVDASVPVNSITVDTLFSADTTPTITGTYANAMKGNDFIQVTVNGKTYTQGDGYLTVNTTNKTWSLQIPDTDAMNVAGNADVKYDITAEIIAAAGGKVADATSEELTIFKNVSINAGPNPDYVDQKPLLNGLIKLGTNESLEVKIYDNDGVLVRTFSSINGANSIDGLTIDTVANTWKIVNANWGANQLEGGNYTAKASVVTKDGSGGQSSTDQAITVIEPKVIPVDNKADDSDIGSKIYALDDGGYLLVWAQNQTKSTETNGTSNYDLVAQRYDQTGQKVGGFIKITDTPTGGSANSEGYGDRMDMWDSYGGFNVYIDANSHLTIAYTASQGQKGFVKVYDDAMNLLSTSQVSGGDYYFGFNTVATSNGNVVVYTSGTLQNYNVYFSGSNNNYATSTKLTNETNGGNGYIYGASQTPAGAAIGNKASNIESLSAISLGGSKVLIQYADFTATNINPTKQNLMVVDYASDGKATIVTSMVANIFDNGWQVGAKSFALKEGGFVSLWASNHESATAATGTAAKGTMDGFDVYARRFNYDDVTKTITALDAQEKRVNTTTDGVNGVGYSTMATGHMSGVALEHGGYVIVWTKMLSNTLSEVYSQSFDAAGNKLGGETLVSTQTVDGTGSVDTLPYVAALADGGYVVTWTNSNQDYKVNSLTADIKSVIVNADGSIRGEGEAPSMSAKYLTGEGELIGTDGVNTLDGRHGATVMEAGNGNDYIIIKDTNFDLIDGGTGSDTLVWDSKADLNLGDILSKVNSIETIHLGDENANTLTISIDDLLSISSTDMLVVQGGDTDLVKLVDQDGWVSAGTQTYRGEVYQVYTHQENIDAMLWIQHNIDVIG